MLLKFAYDEFVAEKKFNNITEATIVSYRYMLRPFLDFCIENGAVNVEDVTRSHFKNYLVEYQERVSAKANTINTIILRVRSFFNYLIEEGYVQENIVKKIKMQKVDIKINTFKDEQVNQMLSFYRGQRKRHQSYSSYRNYVILLVLLGTGCRRKELISLKWDDVDFKSQTISVYGKNRKYETIFLTDKLNREMLAFKAFSENMLAKKTEYVFVTNKQVPFTIHTIEYIFRELKRKMNFKDIRVSPHTFRHTFCRKLCESNVNSFTIQKLMRHENIQTTQFYVNLFGSHLKQENDKHNPLNNFDF